MPNRSIIRATRPSDLPGLCRVLEEVGCFDSEFLDELFDDRSGTNRVGSYCITGEFNGDPIGWCCAELTSVSGGMWNLSVLAVAPAAQHRGFGRRMVAQLEQDLGHVGQRVLTVDLSNHHNPLAAREFFKGIGYEEVSQPVGAWPDGEERIVLSKHLAASSSRC